MKERSEIKRQAKTHFLAQYKPSIGAFIAFFFITTTLSIIINIVNYTAPEPDIFSPAYYSYLAMIQMLGLLSMLLSVLIYPPVTVGHNAFALSIYRGETATVRGTMFRTGFDNYGRKVGGMLWMQLFVFLWSLLFIIPGIIKTYEYFMTPYILADCPDVRATDALTLSMRMTSGYKGDIFLMQLSFLGWGLLSLLTGGILTLFYVGPYYSASMAGMYDDLKNQALADGVITLEDLGKTAETPAMA